MSTTTGNASAASFDFRARGEHAAVVGLKGCLDASSTGPIWRELAHALRHNPPKSLEVDASGIERCEGAGLALLHFLSLGGASTSGSKVTVTGLRPEFQSLFQRFTAEDYLKNRPQPAAHISIFEEVGRSACEVASGAKEQVAFIGDVTAGLVANLPRP